MQKLLKFSALSLSGMLSLMAFQGAYATSYQIFADNNFSNPASLNTIKQGELIIGAMTLNQRFHFTGSTTTGIPGLPGKSGTVSSNTLDLLPYGRVAMRLTPQLVAAVDITQPYFTDIQYPVGSLVSAFATSTIIRDTNISPKLSYQATEKLALGIGFDANNMYNGQLNFTIPPFGNMVNSATSWAYGWDIGAFYTLSRATYLSLAYYSKIVQHASGSSTWGPITNTALSADVKLPATWIATVIQMLSPVWAVSATARYAEWDTLKSTVLQHTAVGVNITIPDYFYNNVSWELGTHYQINQQWGVLAAIDYEPNVQPTWTRNVGLPTYTRTIPAVGVEYELSKGLKAKFVYAHVFSSPPINMSISTGQHITGHDYLNADAFDFSITYDI